MPLRVATSQEGKFWVVSWGEKQDQGDQHYAPVSRQIPCWNNKLANGQNGIEVQKGTILEMTKTCRIFKLPGLL